jgi:hypothetical protein
VFAASHGVELLGGVRQRSAAALHGQRNGGRERQDVDDHDHVAALSGEAGAWSQ